MAWTSTKKINFIPAKTMMWLIRWRPGIKILVLSPGMSVMSVYIAEYIEDFRKYRWLVTNWNKELKISTAFKDWSKMRGTLERSIHKLKNTFN